MVNWMFAGDTFPVGCAFDESNIHHKVINFSEKYVRESTFCSK